jgi:hypothetical protein
LHEAAAVITRSQKIAAARARAGMLFLVMMKLPNAVMAASV